MDKNKPNLETFNVHIGDQETGLPGSLDDGCLKPQSIIANHYRVLEVLGKGGMGVVYKVEHLLLPRLFALKLLKQGDVTSIGLTRFQNEAKAASRLNHPNIVPVIDFGLWNESAPYLVMEYLDGETLQNRIKWRGSLSVDEALPILSQLCDALAFAHEQGVVHRDVKPGNIFLSRSGDSEIARLLDFGIAKSTLVQSDEQHSLTATGEILGSPAYMSPEQCRGKKIDLRSDLYSLGCTLFEMLTGMPPFSSESALGVMLMHHDEVPLSLKQSTLGKEFPEGLEIVVAKLLAKSPDSRYQRANQVKDDLELIKHGKMVQNSLSLKRKSKNKWRILVVGLLVSASIAAFLLFKLPQFEPAPTLTLTPSPTPPAFQVSDKVDESRNSDLMHETLDTLSPPTIEYFSQKPKSKGDNEIRIFVFPKESIGVVRSGLDGREQKAQNEVSLDLTKPLYFQPRPELCQQPKQFRCFRPDEITILDFNWNDSFDDDLLPFFSHFKKLESLACESTELTDKGLAQVNLFPNLNRLSLRNTRVTGEALSKIKRLKDFTKLGAEFMTNVRVFLPILRRSTKLEELFLSGTKISDTDLDQVRECKSLKVLYLDRNRGITDRGIAKLINMPKLLQLDICGCAITPACIDSLKRMPVLRVLYIDLKNWTEQDRVALVKALPGVQISAQQH